MNPCIAVKRVYDPAAAADGQRFLVERLWPRGMARQSLQLTAWLKAVAPSDALRRWFAHDPLKWDEFRRRYYAELDAAGEALATLVDAARQGPVTLLYSAHDTEHNNAKALKAYLESLRNT